jgi:hypothetical protein
MLTALQLLRHLGPNRKYSSDSLAIYMRSHENGGVGGDDDTDDDDDDTVIVLK